MTAPASRTSRRSAHVSANIPVIGGEMEIIADHLVMYMHIDQLSDEIGRE